MTSINVYTDGSFCRKNNTCGYGVYYPNKEFPNKSEKYVNKGTNQRAELYAIYDALNTIIKSDKYKIINVYTDSKYSIGCFTTWLKSWKKNEWCSATGKAIKNLDIIKPTDIIMIEHYTKGTIKFHHVMAHTNCTDTDSKNNDFADQLAKAGAKK